MTRTYIYLISVILLLALFASCKEDDRNKIAVEKVIREEVAEKVNNYRRSRIERCINKAIKEANEIADSILIQQARLSRDTADKPPKPNKPERPELKALQDSSPIAPIFQRDSSLENQ